MDPAVTVASDPPSLLTLPQEVQDMIFSDAYATASGEIPLISKESWQYLEKQSQRELKKKYVVRPFPPPKVNDFMVSKTFFVVAAKAYIGRSTICGSKRMAVRHVDAAVCSGIGGAFMRHIETDLCACYYLDGVQKPKTLTLLISEYHFECLLKDPYDDKLDDEDFATIPYIEPVLALRGLDCLKLKAQPSQSARTDEQRATWDDNIKRFDQLIRSKVMQPRIQSATKCYNNLNGQLQLYSGSRVSASDSRVLRETSTWSGIDGDCGMDLEGLFESTRFRRADAKELTDAEVPDTLDDFTKLLVRNGAGVMKWVQSAKRRLMIHL